jgi:hypothetical protein
MSLFSIFKSDKFPYSDKVWKTKHPAWRGMLTDALLAITQGHTPVVITFFDQTHNELLSFLQQQGVPFYELNMNSISQAMLQEKVVFICSASQISSSTIVDAFLQSVSKKSKMRMLFAGHYPLHAKEEKILRKLRLLSPAATFTFYSSLDEPVFDLFGGDSLALLLEKLGLKDDESIEHSLVSRFMERTRQKLDSLITHEVVMPSVEEWFQRNIKPE